MFSDFYHLKKKTKIKYYLFLNIKTVAILNIKSEITLTINYI